MDYQLSRKESADAEWKMTAKGSAEYITTLLGLNLKSPELSEFEWKITPVN